MRAAAPAARKPTCLRRPVIRADGEFWRGGSLRNEGRICVNPRELNVTKKGACRNSVGFEPSLLMRQPHNPCLRKPELGGNRQGRKHHY